MIHTCFLMLTTTMAGYPNPPTPRAFSKLECVPAEVQTHPHNLDLYFSPSSFNTDKYSFLPDAPVSRISGKKETTQSGFSLQFSTSLAFDVSSTTSGGSTYWYKVAKATISEAVLPPS